MSDSGPLPVLNSPDVGGLVLGMLDVIVAFGAILSNRGILSREEIAAVMTTVIDQQKRREGAPNPSREFPAATLKAFFALPVLPGGRGTAGLVSIDGGKAAGPPATAAAVKSVRESLKSSPV